MHVLLVTTRLLLAALLGALLGLEREFNNRAAGFRTHIIVSTGACLIMLIGIDGINGISYDKGWDATRLAAQVVSGIGFLGAGTILQKKDVVSGLTTAATLWLSAAIGLAVGIGYYEGALIATIICLITLITLKRVTDLVNKRISKSYLIFFNPSKFNQYEFLNFIAKEGVELIKLDMVDEDMADISAMKVTLSFARNYNISMFFNKVKAELDLTVVELTKHEFE